MVRRLLHREFLLFIGLTSLIWVLITVGNAKRFANVVIEVNSPAAIVGDQYIIDTSIALNVDVSATGLNAIRLLETDGAELVLDASSFSLNKEGFYSVASKEVASLLHAKFDGNYNFTITTEHVLFPCEPLQRIKLPISISGWNNISLPEGYKWLEPIALQPDSVEVVGSAEAVRKAALRVDLPEFKWEGGHALDLPIKGLGDEITTVDFDRVEAIGKSALWTEKKLIIPTILDQQIVDIEVWLSAPKSILNNQLANQLVQVTWKESGMNYSIDCQSLQSNITILSVQPTVVERFK